jgi:tRNA-2-methylthio-N6-dimethylallyladenosine synthase
VRFTTSHPRDFTRDIVEAIDAYPTCATMCICRCSRVGAGAEDDGQGIHAGLVPGADLLDQGARRPISLSTDIIVGFPGETPEDFIQTMDLLAEVEYDCVFGFKYSGGPTRRR